MDNDRKELIEKIGNAFKERYNIDLLANEEYVVLRHKEVGTIYTYIPSNNDRLFLDDNDRFVSMIRLMYDDIYKKIINRRKQQKAGYMCTSCGNNDKGYCGLIERNIIFDYPVNCDKFEVG